MNRIYAGRTFACFMVTLLITFFFAFKPVFAAYGLDSSVTESRAEEIYQGAEDRLEAIYQEAVSKAKSGQGTEFSVAVPATWLVEQFYIIYRAVKDSARVVGSVVALFGCIMAWIVHRNKKLFRDIVITVIVFEILLIAFCFGGGILIG